ncbi:MAG: ChbG/HpnK family deacetylase [Clostridia bacterium]|nr:ChbG/HpnK family deacetylase [Clostridia bacterium]
MKFFINADDFGMTKTKTEAIDKGIRSGLIQRASIVMNGSETETAVKLAKEGGYEDRLCLHLNIAECKPLTDEFRKTRLCDKDGNIIMMYSRRFLMHCLSPKFRKAMAAEFEAQIKKFRDYGFKSKHIDSHIWCMCYLPTLDILQPLLKKYGFETTRTMYGHRLSACGGYMYKYNRKVYKRIKEMFELPTHWAGCAAEFSKDLAGHRLKPHYCIELYVHPAMHNGEVVDLMFDYDRVEVPLSKEISIINESAEHIDIFD